MSGQATFDPYHSWLGIHPSEQPADFYRLLGICRFESDVGVIQSAYVQRFNYLSRFRGTSHDSAARQLADELSSAQTMLLSPVLKASYDAALLAAVQPPPLHEPQQYQLAPEPEPEPAAIPYDPPVIVRTTKRKTNNPVWNGPLGQIGGGLIGLVLAALILCWLRPDLDRFGLFHSTPGDPAPKKEPNPKPPRTDRADVVRPTPPPPDFRRPEPPPAPDRQPKPFVPEAPPPAEFPAQVELPAREGKAAVDTALVAGRDIAIEVRNPEANPMQFVINDGQDQQTWTITSNEQAMAYLRRENGRIRFTWDKDAPEQAECLRNTLLAFIVENEEHGVRLRTTMTANPPTVDLEKEMMAVPHDVELWGLDVGALQFEVLGTQDGMTVQRFDPINHQATLNQKVRAILRDQAPYAAFDLSLTKVGNNLAFKIWPLMAGENSQPIPWTSKTAKTLVRKLATKINQANKIIANGPATIQTLQNNIQRLRNVPADSPFAAAAITELATSEATLIQAQAALAEARAGLPIWKKALEDLKVLIDLGNDVHDVLKIRYRIFYKVSGDEIDVYSAGGQISGFDANANRRPL